MKGIILAGGMATRLYPVTKVISKQLLPIYNKPMIFYPLCTLMQSGIRDVLIISTPSHLPLYIDLLGNGSSFGINIEYIIQENPKGLAEAFMIGENFINDEDCALILGDNLFFGNKFHESLIEASTHNEGALVFAYHVDHPESYGVVGFNDKNIAISIEEKPLMPKSNYAVTGLYFYDNNVVDFAKSIKPSLRGELEISDLNNIYLSKGKLKVSILRSGTTWLDTGTHNSLMDASLFVRTIENRQGTPIGSPEAVAFKNGWIEGDDVMKLISEYPDDHGYKKLLIRFVEEQ
jgi:glucose-1-phosphate thymidylyltransferase